jgi:hypothetical protein
MIAALFLLAISLSGEAAPPAQLTLDLDGRGAVESATAVPRGSKVRLEVRDSRGKLLAESLVPAPGGNNPRVAITAGSLGSAGALLEVAAITAETECRSLWRYRDDRLSQTPVLASAGPLPDCGPPEWSSRWDRPSVEAPAFYIRERSRQRPNGVFRQVEAFRYAGFRLESEAGRSSASINGVVIPAWRDAILYRRAAVEQLASRFDLSPFQSQARLRVLADRVEGVFEVRIEDSSSQGTFPVTAASPSAEKAREVILTAGTPGIRVRILPSLDGSVPLEAIVEGLGGRLDGGYLAVTQRRESGLRVYDSAEQELAEEFLPGTWDDGKGPVIVKLVSSSPVLLQLGQSDVSLSVTRAARGADVLLLPKDGSLPVLGILLRGPDSLVQVPVHCEAGAQRCEASSAGRLLRRVGARLNIR